MKIIVFVDQIFPIEHLKGLLTIAKKSSTFIDFVFVTKGEIDPSMVATIFHGKLTLLSDSKAFSVLWELSKADLAICVPSKYFFMRVLSRIKLLKFVPLYFGPGKVTKAVGYYKHPEKGAYPALYTYVKCLLLNTNYLANDEKDKLYCAAALGYPLTNIIVAKLPKYYFINEQLCIGKKRNRPPGVLIAPTHRWGEKIPILTELLVDSKLQSRLKETDLKIYHSKHPDTKNLPLDSNVISFSGNWDEIDIVVTDYSSIGDDFINSGGCRVIYYVPDRDEFELNQGAGLLFDNSLALGIVCLDIDELCSTLFSSLERSSQNVVTKFSCPNYFNEQVQNCKGWHS